MIRIFSILVGLFFTAALAWSLASGPDQLRRSLPHTVEAQFHKHPKHLSLASDGVFGKFDKQQLQRGFQVYKEVCAACHSLRHVAFRDLDGARLQRGRSEGDRRQGARSRSSIRNTGEVKTRAGLPTDHFPPFANDIAARAQQQCAPARPVADDQGARTAARPMSIRC